MTQAGTMFFRFEQQKGAAIITFQQPYLGPAEVEDFSRQMHRHLAVTLASAQSGAAPKLVLDLSAIEYMASRFLGVVVDLHQQTAEHNGALRLCGLRPRLKELLALMHLDLVLAIDPTAQDALRNLA